MATKKTANLNDFKTEDIDKLFSTVPKGTVFTGTGYGMKKPKTATKKATPAKKKVKRSK